MHLATRLLTTILLVLLGWQAIAPGAAHAHEPADAALGYTGAMQRTDGTVDLRARSYQPDLGRFLQRDPFPGVLARPQALNRAAYVEGNPLAFTDPSGFVRAPHGAFDWPAPAPPSYPQQTRLTAPRGSLAEALAQNYQAQRAWDCLSPERKISLKILQGMGLVSQLAMIGAPTAQALQRLRSATGAASSPDQFSAAAQERLRAARQQYDPLGLQPRMMLDRVIRPFSRRDRAAMEQFVTEGQALASPTRANFALDIYQAVTSGTDTVIVVREGDAIVGAMTLHPEYAQPDFLHVGYLQSNRPGQGIGSDLVRTAWAISQEQGYRGISLSPAGGTGTASTQAFYDRLGPTSTNPGDYYRWTAPPR